MGGGVGGGIPASFPSRSPPPKQPFQPTPHAFARLPPGLRKNRNLGFCGEKAPGPWWAGPQALGARAPSPLETWPTGRWGLDPATLTAAVPVFAPAFQMLRLAGPKSPGDLANKPLSPASWSRIPKMPRCSSAHEKPGLLHRLISYSPCSLV